MKFRIEPIILFVLLIWIANSAIQGNSQVYFAPHIIIPFGLVFLAILIFIYGFSGLLQLAHAIAVLFVTQARISSNQIRLLDGAIAASYASASLWVVYAAISAFEYLESSPVSHLVSQMAVAICYGFVTAEFILRPAKSRIVSLLGSGS